MVRLAKNKLTSLIKNTKQIVMTRTVYEHVLCLV